MTRSTSLTALAFALALFLVDQAIKYAVTVVLDLDTLSAVREILPFFRLTFVANCGISLGLLGEYADNQMVRAGLAAVTSLIAVGVFVWMWREKNGADRLALAAILGGAMGNIADRLIPHDILGKVTAGRVGYPGCVIDYADFHFGDWRPFLVFNFADAAITIGVLILLARALLMRQKPAPAENVNA